MSEKQSKALETFNSGCNCAQSVLTSFSEKLEMNSEQLMAVSAGFGAGMGRLQETCGAATGAYMVFSIYTSKNAEDNDEAKDGAATMIRKFTKRFIEIVKAYLCKEE